MQAQISLRAKIGYMYCCEYAHLIKKCTEHTCMSSIYYDQSSDIKADKCKITVTFDTLLESKILDADNNLQKPVKMLIEHLTLNMQHTTYLTGPIYVNAP